MEEAERAHLVSAEPAAGREMRYRFVHELVRQTLAETLSMPRRQRLHARVAGAIERVYAANLEARHRRWRYHLYQAGAAADPEKTTSYLMIAAQQARANAAHEEALAHLENALSVWEGEESSRVAELTAQKGAVLLSLGRPDEAADYCRKAIAMFENAGAVAQAARTGWLLAGIHVWRLEYAAFNRTVDRALERLGSAEPDLRSALMSGRAAGLSAAGDIAGAARLRAELGATEDFAMVAFYAHSMQYELALEAIPRVVEAYRARGDLWGAVESGVYAGFATYCGLPAGAARDLPGVMQVAEKIGHHGASLIARLYWALLAAARGNLGQAEREIEDAWNFGETHQLGYLFVTDTARAGIAYLRGNLREAERFFSYRKEPLTFLSGSAESSLFALWAESRDPRASDAWTERRWKLPRAGQLNSVGAWTALERSVVGLAWMGRKEEVATLRPLTEALVGTGVWVSRAMLPFRTTAGIAAACMGDWSAAEEHHLTAIHQADTAPHRPAQPMAREWYALMLLDRNGPGDAAKARDLLSEALAMYESLVMPFHANRTSAKLAAL